MLENKGVGEGKSSRVRVSGTGGGARVSEGKGASVRVSRG